LLPYAVLAMLAGPVVAGPLLIGLFDGGRSPRAPLAAARWRVAVRWYAVALFTAPLIELVTLLALALVSADFLPELFGADAKAALLLAGIAVGLVAGLEELGWAGSAVPILRLRYGVLTVGLAVGLLWGAWHVPVTLAGCGSPSGSLVPTLCCPRCSSTRRSFRLSGCSWCGCNDRTDSLLVAILMHASLTASMVILAPQAASGTSLIASYLALATGLCVVAGVIATVDRSQHRHPSSR
jgi:uncharacterized protein